ncbi:MAG: sigma-70 family RNA polymerase sigma factor [Lachnospira sp.]|nr:sigma-70 family RNA polymerase sigma factor [Lachnospira sp.]
MIDQYIRQYGKRLYGLCMTLCANRDDADDLYQDTWIKVVKNIDSYDTSKEFEPWLTRICVNTYRNGLRRLMKSPIFNGFANDDEKQAVIENVKSPEATDYSYLHEAIDKLPEKLRVTVILFYFKDMDVAATSATLGIPEGTVKSRLNKARKLLKEVLDNDTDIRF